MEELVLGGLHLGLGMAMTLGLAGSLFINEHGINYIWQQVACK